MRRIERTLLIKREKFRNSERLSSCTGLEFLHGLRLSFSDWLGEAEAETMASLEGVARCGIHYRRECLAQSSLPQDRTKICAILLQKLRCCEEQWRRAFDKGRGLDTLSVPSLTKGVSCDHSTAPYQVPSWMAERCLHVLQYLAYEQFRTEILGLRKRSKRPL